MNSCKFYTAGFTPALSYAINFLKERNFTILSQPEKATHLLLPVPSFEPDGRIKGGGALADLLTDLPADITIFGGNLDRPELAGYRTVDFLKDPLYLAQNANITAHCAVNLAMAKLPVTLQNCPSLIIGWGRIGKCLAQLLRQLGADVTVAARKETDRATLTSLGYAVADTGHLETAPFRVIFNTVPAIVSADCPGKALKIDLASSLGLGSPDVIWARGLPNKDAPESSGELIARTAIRIATGKETDT
jgi:dipicolinate synthase subunit A